MAFPDTQFPENNVEDRIRQLLYWIILFLLALMAMPSYGQESPVRFERFSIADGLSQSTVRAIIQDQHGFLWVGTQDGLNKYDGYTFKVFQFDPNLRHTLSNNFILDLLEDRDGIIWIGTRRGGLNRFDPKNEQFKSYRSLASSRFSLASNQVQVMCEGPQGRLWVGTDKGLHLFDRKREIFTRFEDQDASAESNIINNMLVAEDGRLWLATEAGLRVFDPTDKSFTPIGKGEGLTAGVRALCLVADGFVLAGTSSGVWQVSTRTHQAEFLPFQGNSSLSVLSISPYEEGKVWLGTLANGVVELDLKNGSTVQYRHRLHYDQTLSNDHVFDIFRDRSGAMWVGCYEGMNKYDHAVNYFHSFSHDPAQPLRSLIQNNVRGIATEADGTIWVATRGGGLTCFPTKGKAKHYRHDPADPQSLPTDLVEAVLVDREGAVWAGTQLGLCRFDPNKNSFTLLQTPTDTRFWQDNNHVHEIREDGKGFLWLGTKGGLNRFDKATGAFVVYQDHGDGRKGLKGNYVRAIFEDRKGQIWVGTYDGLNCLTPGEGEGAYPTFRLYEHDPWNPNSLSYNYVRAVFEDENGSLWIGTAGGGLNKMTFAPKDGGENAVTFERFSTRDGLANNSIYGILADQSGCLWISTNKELSRFDPQKGNFKNYGLKDGLQSNEFNQGAYHQDAQGNMYFGGLSGMSVFHPAQLQDNAFIPPVVLTDFQLFNKSVPIGAIEGRDEPLLGRHINETEVVQLRYFESFLTFEFAALNFRHPEHNQYAYLMEGYETQWNEIGSNRTATYTNLPPGEYHFRIKASNNDHVWNEQAKVLKIVIAPPFWQTAWFRVLVLVALVLAAYAWHRSRVRRVEKRKEELEHLVDVRTSELRKEKELVEEANKRITLQNEEILEQKKELVRKNIKITDSLRYAETIQQAVLPDFLKIRRAFEDLFVIYRPKDIVSGDFYWFSTVKKPMPDGSEQEVAVAAVIDCTGHGVPGAFMSLIGNAILNQIVNERKITDGKTILELLNARIIQALKQDREANTDGMDLCLVTMEKTVDGRILVTFSGAKRPLYVYKSEIGKVQMVKGARKSIGGMQPKNKQYITEIFYLSPGDLLYLTTDGLADQNSPTGDKFGRLKLIDQLNLVADTPLPLQKKALEEALEAHQCEMEQRDDITVMGIRV